jgi:8-oxo-dGTP diphosphatase
VVELNTVVQSAGGVVWRTPAPGDHEIALVHRPRYDDWSLPKGKLEPGEEWEYAALREVEEETGVRGELVRELDPVAYLDRKGRHKLVRWWLMRPLGGAFEANDEVDELRWEPLDAAVALLDYPHDHELVRAVIDDFAAGVE